jgi:hypothetical protein
MNETEQLSWEARVGRLVAPAAFLAPILLIGGSVYTTSALGSIPNDATEIFLVRIHQHAGPFIGGAVVAGIGILLLIPVFLFMFRVIKVRRPQIPRVAVYLAVAGPIAAMALGIVRQVEFVHVANKFAPTVKITHVAGQEIAEPTKAASAAAEAKKTRAKNAQDYLNAVKDLSARGRADKQLKSGGVRLVAEIGLVANIALGIEFVLIGLNGLRAGLFSRFMGILAVFIGILTVLPIFDATILQLFWLGALGLLLLDRWPGGRGPAWSAVEAIPWPTAQDRREQAEARKPAGRPAPGAAASDGNGAGTAAELEEATGGAVATAQRERPAPQHPRSKKRKRKRRG